MKFDKRQTNIAKGLALLLLLWHHLFLITPEINDEYISLFPIANFTVEGAISYFFKVCVAIFMMLSGYGLFKSYDVGKSKSISKIYPIRYVASRLIGLLSDYWFVFIIFVPLGFLFGRECTVIYDGSVQKFLADFFGVSYFVYGFDATMNESWWYMSTILLNYLIFPILYRIEKISGELLLGIAALLQVVDPIANIYTFEILTFAVGMYLADKGVLDRLGEQTKKKIISPLLASAALIAAIGYIRLHYFNPVGQDMQVDVLFAIPFIMLSFTVLSKIPVINKVLEKLGEYSGMIYMFHSFLFAYYFKSFVYMPKYSLLIYVIFVVECFVLAVVLTQFKKLIRYDKLFSNICKKISSR